MAADLAKITNHSMGLGGVGCYFRKFFGFFENYLKTKLKAQHIG